VAPVNKLHAASGKVLTTSAIASVSPDFEPHQDPILNGPSTHPRWFRTHRWVAFSAAGVVVAISLVVMAALGFAPAEHIGVARYTLLTHDGFAKLDGSLLSDGVRVYFQEIAPSGYTLGNVSANGGDTGQIPLPKGFDFIYDLLPRTSEVLVGQGPEGKAHQFWAVSLIDGGRRRVSSLYVTDAKWSPDGSQIAFALRQELQVAKADGSQNRRIAAMFGIVSAPRWSPDQRTIRFTEISPDNSWRAIWKFARTGPICTGSCLDGMIFLRNAAVFGHRMENSSSFSQTAEADETCGRFQSGEASAF